MTPAVALNPVMPRLLPDGNGGVDVLAWGESRFVRRGGRDALVSDSETRAARGVRGEPVAWEQQPSLATTVQPLFARLEGGAIAFMGDDGVRVATGQGPPRTVFSPGTFDDGLVLDLAAAPGGAVLATTRASDVGHLHIRRIDPRSGRASLLVEDACQPAFSPTGDRIAFARISGETFQIVVAPTASPGNITQMTQMTQLTRGAGHAAFPTWSPDGRRLAFLTRPVRDLVHYDRFEGESALWVLDLEGHAERMTAGASLELAPPAWTSEGLWVLTWAAGERRGTVLWKVVPRPWL